MRGTVAKQLRRKVYGKGHHPGTVKYFRHQRSSTTIVSDEKRWEYQQAKKEHRE